MPHILTCRCKVIGYTYLVIDWEFWLFNSCTAYMTIYLDFHRTNIIYSRYYVKRHDCGTLLWTWYFGKFLSKMGWKRVWIFIVLYLFGIHLGIVVPWFFVSLDCFHHRQYLISCMLSYKQYNILYIHICMHT